MEGLGERIAQYRKDKHMTQQDVANLVNVTPQAVSRWEQDITLPDVNMISHLARIFDVSVDELLNGKPVNKVVEDPVYTNVTKLKVINEYGIPYEVEATAFYEARIQEIPQEIKKAYRNGIIWGIVFLIICGFAVISEIQNPTPVVPGEEASNAISDIFMIILPFLVFFFAAWLRLKKTYEKDGEKTGLFARLAKHDGLFGGILKRIIHFFWYIFTLPFRLFGAPFMYMSYKSKVDELLTEYQTKLEQLQKGGSQK